ncbi:MAG TPA: hypothetical protein VJO36_02855 [Actinomycetota bacterium]|nr:hypothetical protein [Actinomycetota bacterium]
MDVGLFIRYGKLVPGREAQAIELFEETKKYFEDKVQQKAITYFEPFFLRTSDLEEETGFFILKGPAPEIFKIMEEEKYLWLMSKGAVLVEHLRADLLTVGEGIYTQLDRAGKVRVELGF